MRRIVKYFQPAGFLLLLLHFVSPQLQEQLYFFWAGVALSLGGSIIEMIFFLRIPSKIRVQPVWVFTISTLNKILLIAAIIYRVYDLPYSYFILLGCIVIAFIWFFIQSFIKKSKVVNEEILDAD